MCIINILFFYNFLERDGLQILRLSIQIILIFFPKHWYGFELYAIINMSQVHGSYSKS